MRQLMYALALIIGTSVIVPTMHAATVVIITRHHHHYRHHHYRPVIIEHR